jgi:hypothetical protein
MDRATSRARRLNGLRQIKRMQERLRDLARTLAEMEQLDDVDAVGVVEIEPGAEEADYASDLLDVITHALSDAGRSRTVKVIVTSPRRPTTTGRQDAHRRQHDPQARIQRG